MGARAYMLCRACNDWQEIVAPVPGRIYESMCPFCEEPDEQVTECELEEFRKERGHS